MLGGVEALAANAASGGRQLSMDSFVVSYADNVKIAQVMMRVGSFLLGVVHLIAAGTFGTAWL